jgi:hypothetical protein
MIKRVADLLEKIAAGSFLIGLFQGQNLALVFGSLTFTTSLILTRGLERRAK